MLTPDDYVHVLLGRQAAATVDDRWPPLLEWMVRPGDERLFTPPAPSRTALSERKPRRYRPASYWRIRLERTDARLAVLTAEPTERPDMAAYGGVGIRETHRQRERRWSRLDRDLAEHTRLTVERDHYARMLQAAERREAS